ncbi:helix-turn-helix transcriptional regulator [Clostridium gasigenes]|uniref:helix-turn-helix domain-containing protein n=1 Tax=Clostridium gasigenes TaxID=94869 RepID=UPI001C0AC646|nr:helix-turn-helix transcriptional regulator [Clostridium gasigenes]MBU3107119.1 helix-turn-helix transcriptional regulator [Clostridium gasigenes]
MQFSDRLRELREDNGLTQDDVAERLNLTRQSVSSYEKGNSEPSLANLVKLAELYNCSCDYLLCITKERFNLNILNKDNKDFILNMLKLVDKYNIKRKARD